jgi:acyl-CoA reductase-like NAD-dependent aldehyde dehydrogenase
MRGVQFLRACASALQHFAGEVVPVDAAALGAGHFGFTRHVPYGVVAGITPFNAPVNLLVQKLGPALAAGNAMVVKPHPAGLRTARAVAEIMLASGLPEGLFNVVSGDRAAAAALVRHPLVRAVTFTGGTAGGRALMREAGLKKFVAELGSNAANVVLADADLADAARKIAGAAFEASGQQCISAQRVIVEQGAYDRFLPLFVAAAQALRVGAAREDTTDVGPMVSMAAADRVMAMCADAIARGARYALQPKRDGCIVSPAILVDVPRDAQLWTDEVFGPAAVVVPVADIDAALAAANDSPFGLQGAVFTRSLAAAFRFSEELEVGSLWVNEASRFRLDMYPFGGVKDSGIGREGVRYAIEEMSQLRFVGIKP